MEKPTIKANQAKFRKILGQYIKHKGLDIELTMKDGNRLVMTKMRRIEGEILVQTNARGETSVIPIQDIRNLEVYVN